MQRMFSRFAVSLCALLVAVAANGQTIDLAQRGGWIVKHGQCVHCQSPLNLSQVLFVNDRSIWASAYFLPEGSGTGISTILRTSDGGDHWKHLAFAQQQSAELEPAISIVDAKNVWIASFDSGNATGILHRTVDGGRLWTHKPCAAIVALRFFDGTHGYGIGSDLTGAFFYDTSDGGEHWNTKALPLSHVQLMDFADASTGIVIGLARDDTGAQPAALRTSNGGQDWVKEALPGVMPGARPTSLARKDTKTLLLSILLANDNGSMLVRTDDDGLTWRTVANGPFVGPNMAIRAAVLARSGKGYVFYTDMGIGHGYVSKTKDDGATWSTAESSMSVSWCGFRETSIVCTSGMNVARMALDTD